VRGPAGSDRGRGLVHNYAATRGVVGGVVELGWHAGVGGVVGMCAALNRGWGCRVVDEAGCLGQASAAQQVRFFGPRCLVCNCCDLFHVSQQSQHHIYSLLLEQ
jgi:hypothetical protein